MGMRFQGKQADGSNTTDPACVHLLSNSKTAENTVSPEVILLTWECFFAITSPHFKSSLSILYLNS